MLPGIAFHTSLLAIKVIAPVWSHCTHWPRAFADNRSSNHSSIWVRGLSTRENFSTTGTGGSNGHDDKDGWMDGLNDSNYNC